VETKFLLKKQHSLQSPQYAIITLAATDHACQPNPATPAIAQKMSQALTVKSRCLVTTGANTKEFARILTWKQKSAHVFPGTVDIIARLKMHA